MKEKRKYKEQKEKTKESWYGKTEIYGTNFIPE